MAPMSADELNQESVTDRHVARLKINATLTINKLLVRSKTNFFVTTPISCNATNYDILKEQEAYYYRVASSDTMLDQGPLRRIKNIVPDWPGNEEQQAGKKSAVSAHADGAAKGIIRGMTPRVICLTEEELDQIIDLTHTSTSTKTISKAGLRKWFRDYIDGYLTRILDWVEVRLQLCIAETGNLHAWFTSTVEDRLEFYYHLLNQFPVAVWSGFFSARIAENFDFRGVYANKSDPERVAWQTFLSHLFAMVMEDTLWWRFGFLGARAAEEAAAQKRRKNQLRFLCRTDPTLISIGQKLGGMGDVPAAGHDSGKISPVDARLPGIGYTVARPNLRVPGNGKSPQKGTAEKRKRALSDDGGQRID